MTTALLILLAAPLGDSTIFDFLDRAGRWRTIDDVVMGGESSSSMTTIDGVAIFAGAVSLESGGGFASVRSTPSTHDLSPFDGIAILVRGDGRRYDLRLRTDTRFDGVSWSAPFTTTAGTWQEIALPFAAFEPRFRGRRVESAGPLEPGRVRTFGFLIADGQEGRFRLEIDRISGWTSAR